MTFENGLPRIIHLMNVVIDFDNNTLLFSQYDSISVDVFVPRFISEQHNVSRNVNIHRDKDADLQSYNFKILCVQLRSWVHPTHSIFK